MKRAGLKGGGEEVNLSTRTTLPVPAQSGAYQ